MDIWSCNHNSILLKSWRTKSYIMSQLLLIFLFLGILNCEAQYFNTNPYDYLELALRWPNSYCLTHDGGCREIVPQYFTISYLRPRQREGPDKQYCPSPFTMPNSTVSISFIPIRSHHTYNMFCLWFQVFFRKRPKICLRY